MESFSLSFNIMIVIIFIIFSHDQGFSEVVGKNAQISRGTYTGREVAPPADIRYADKES